QVLRGVAKMTDADPLRCAVGCLAVLHNDTDVHQRRPVLRPLQLGVLANSAKKRHVQAVHVRRPFPPRPPLPQQPETGRCTARSRSAYLALLIGCGLRRDELVNLTFGHLQQREGRWVIVDIVGKGRRVRTVPVPGWAKALVDAWAVAAGLHSGLVLRRFRKGGWLVYETTADGE